MQLFTPLTIGNTTFKNRIVMSPMCMYSCMDESGKAGDWHKVHYTTRAIGQAGLIIVEATAVTPQGRISVHDLGIWSDEHIEGLSQLTQSVHQYGAKIGIQIAHAGRKSTVPGPIIAPSALPFDERSRTPLEMTAQQIHDTVQAFQAAAARAKKAGFDVIEIHGAHGYLLNEFLSPLANQRTDEYGGDAQGRFRLLREVIEAVKQVWDGVLFVRISASDYHPDGLAIDDYVEYAKELKKLGVDLIDCSSGAVVPARINVFPGYQVPFADKIRSAANIRTGAVGMITEPLHAEEIIANGRADMVLLARELLRDPYWPRTAAAKLGVKLDPPKQYERGWA